MLVLAGCSVGSGASAQLDFALIEVFFKVEQFGVGHWAVFVGGPGSAAAVEVGLVVADEVFVEDRDVSPSCLKIQMSE
ncbi:hypothetical protein ACIBK9_50265 [Nonomuraea sp. NPDC050227]|uniref:hypothetical protein n=1 Tax=Nonomuraea sp. NPDC050227 TaxID=3364360 RepID=UPI0037A85801